ncbi:MAG TPA: RNase P subunit p30 family protein [archaeon]|nr:RNase P subunit p30 family protein [archaeon]
MFYDLHVHSTLSIGENSVEEMAEMGKRLGLAGIGVVQYYSGVAQGLPEVDGIEIIPAMMVKAAKAAELNSLAEKLRSKSELLMVHGGDYDINRAACENPLIDVLCHPELGRKDSGLDHICIRAAHDNNVAIEINFREVLESYKRNRVYVLSSMKKNVELCRKYETKIVTSSSAVTRWNMRSGRELASLANLLGLELGKAIDTTSTIPERIIRENREKLAGKRTEGVRVSDE